MLLARYRLTSAVLLVMSLIAGTMSAVLATEVIFAGASSIQKTIDTPGPYFAGSTVDYRLTVSCSSLSETCGVATVTDVLDNTLSFESISTPAGWAHTVDGQRVEVIKDGFTDGETAEFILTVRINPDVDPQTVIPNSAQVHITEPDEGQDPIRVTEPVVLEVDSGLPQYHLKKNLVGVAPEPGGQATYEVKFCADKLSGTSDLVGATMVDTFPEGAIVVDSAGGIVAGNTITWVLGDVDVSALGWIPGQEERPRCFGALTYILEFPESKFPEGTVLANTVVGTATTPDGQEVGIGDSLETTVTVARTDLTLTKKAGQGGITAGEPSLFDLVIDTSQATIDIPNVVVEDTIEFDYKIIELSMGNRAVDGLRADISISTDDGATWDMVGSGLRGNQLEQRSVPDELIPDSGVTNVRWEFYREIDGVRVDSVAPNTSLIARIRVEIPSDAQIGETISNCGYLTYDNGRSSESCVELEVTEKPTPDFRNASKQFSRASAAPGDEVKVTLVLHSVGTAEVIHPVIADLLPPQLEFVRFEYDDPDWHHANLVPDIEPEVEVVENYNGTGQTLVRASWPQSTIPSSATRRSAKIVFTTRVAHGNPVETIDNTGYLSVEGGDPACGRDRDSIDVNDIDGDGDTTDLICTIDASLEVVESAAALAEKWVLGHPGLNHVDHLTGEPQADCPDYNGFTRFPCVALTRPGGEATYDLVITNVGNVPLNDYVLYDVLPHLGDVGVSEQLSVGPRKSEWVPELDGPIEPSTEAQKFDPIVEYSTSSEPCRPEVSDSIDESGWQTGCDNNWTTSPADYNAVKSFRVRIPFATPWLPGEQMTFRVPMVAPTDSPFDVVAWNSVAYRVSNAVSGQRLRTAEPRKVGLRVPGEDELPEIDDPVYRLGNLVWNDDNNDGIANQGESGIEGVSVKAYRDSDATPGPSAQDTLAASALTDADGHYRFENLAAGDYYVVIQDGQIVLNGATSSTDRGEPGTDNDNDDNGVNALTVGDGGPVDGLYSSVVTLGEGDGDSEPTTETVRDDNTTDDDDDDFPDNRSNLSVDFGFYRLRLGNRVWLDTGEGSNHNNAIVDSDESGIPGVTVELWSDDDKSATLDPDSDTFIGFTITDANGEYWFEDLEQGVPYIVAIPEADNGAEDEALAGLESSLGQFRSGDNRDDGQAQPGYFAVAKPVVIVAATAPAGETERDTGANSEESANYSTGYVPDTNSDLTIDFGFIDTPVYRLGNLVWNDIDDDGQAEVGEPGIGGVFVALRLDDDGVRGPSNGDPTVAVKRTDSDGHYMFDELAPGNYYVVIPPGQRRLSGFRSSDQGEEIEANSDGDNNDNGLSTDVRGLIASSTVTLGEGNGFEEPIEETRRVDDRTSDEDGDRGDFVSNLTVDFGFYQLSLGNQVWFDTNNNGEIDRGESPIPGVTVKLYVDSGEDALLAQSRPVATTSTDENGMYLFTGLENNTTYRVSIGAVNFAPGGSLHGYYSSDPVQDETDIDGRDYGINPAEPGQEVYSHPVSISAGEEPTGERPAANSGVVDVNENLTVDFGFYTMAVGNRVWFDSDNDGVQDEGEPNIEGVEVQLWLDSDGDGSADSDTPLDVDVTDQNGLYLFAGLDEGTYLVSIPDTNWGKGQPLEGQELSPGGGIGDSDTDNNGIQSASGETVWSGPITLDGGRAPTGETPDNGVRAVPDTNQNLTVDFGFHSMSLGNRVWLDIVTDNGINDDGEPGVGGVTVQLIDPATDTVVDTTVTDAEGYYLFTGLRDGDEFLVRIPASNFAEGEPLAGYVSTVGNGVVPPDPDDDVDLDDNGAGVTNDDVDAEPVTLSAGSEPLGETEAVSDLSNTADDANTNLTVDFGFLTTPDLSLGNRLWFDEDNSGLLDQGERGAPGVTVHLYRDTNGDGKADTDVAFQSTVTDQDGYYMFHGLAEGDYLAMVPASQFDQGGALEGWHSSTGASTVNDDVDDDDSGIDPPVVGGDVWSSTVSLMVFDEPVDERDKPEGQLDFDVPSDANANTTVDFGFYELAGIGDWVWDDENRDGIQDEEETPVAGVRVVLLDDDGEEIAETVTNNEGYYEFINLPVGTYQVRFDLDTLPAGYMVTESDQGDDDAADSDGNPETGMTEFTDLAGGEFDPTWDLGIHQRRSVLEVDKVASSETVVAGDDIVWLIEVTNTGPDPMVQGFSVVEELPEGLEVESWTGEGWECEVESLGDNVCRYDELLGVSQSTSVLTVVTPTVAAQAGLVVSNGVRVEPPVGDKVVVPGTDSAPVVMSSRLERGNLAFTGASTLMMLVAGAALTTAGVVLVLGSRRARPKPTI